MGLEYIGNDKKYSQLSAEERGKIEACCALDCSISEIARLIKRSKSTIRKEINPKLLVIRRVCGISVL